MKSVDGTPDVWLPGDSKVAGNAAREKLKDAPKTSQSSDRSHIHLNLKRNHYAHSKKRLGPSETDHVQCNSRIWLFPSDEEFDRFFWFFSRLKNFRELHLSFSIDTEIIRAILEKLPFLWQFDVLYNKNKLATIETVPSKRYWVHVTGRYATVNDVNAVIQFITDESSKKRKM